MKLSWRSGSVAKEAVMTWKRQWKGRFRRITWFHLTRWCVRLCVGSSTTKPRTPPRLRQVWTSASLVSDRRSHWSMSTRANGVWVSWSLQPEQTHGWCENINISPPQCVWIIANDWFPWQERGFAFLFTPPSASDRHWLLSHERTFSLQSCVVFLGFRHVLLHYSAGPGGLWLHQGWRCQRSSLRLEKSPQ